MASAVLIALILSPAILTYFLRSNGALAFLSLGAASLLATYVSDGLSRLIEQVAKLYWAPDNLSLSLILLTLVLTLLLTRKAISRSKFVVHLIPALAAGGLLALLVEPLLSGSLQAQMLDSRLWQSLHNVQALVVGVGILTSLLLVWLGHFGGHRKHHK